MSGGSKSGIFAFDDFQLDSGKLMLYRDGAEVSIPPKVARTLAVLVESAGTIITKDEVIERVWDDSIVEESNLTQYLYLLRKVLGNMPDGRPYIETLRRRGYRFNGEVKQIRDEKPAAQPATARAQTDSAPQVVGVEREGNVLRVVDWQTTEPPAGEPQPVTAPTTASTPLPPSKRSVFPRVALAIAGLALAVIGGLFAWPRLMPAPTNAESQAELSVTRLTNGFYPHAATISPDGNVFVYHELDGETSRMFVQQTGQASRIEIETSTDKLHGVKTFSPDGQSVYYVSGDKKNGLTSLQRIPTMGGGSVKIVDDIQGAATFSPDGKEIAFRRRNPTTGDTAIAIVGPDGRGERIVLERRHPKLLVSSIAWSPDGKVIVFGDRDNYGEKSVETHRLHLLNVATGRTTPLSHENWENILRIAWAPDGSGIFMVGTRQGEGYSTRRDQVYFISFPDGVSRRLTNDGNRHEPDSLGVTKRGEVFAVTANRSTQIWVMNSDGNTNSAVQLTKGTADGRAGIGPLPDGRFGYLARTGEEISIMLANGDASSTKQLATGFQFIEELRADPLGRFFVFSAPKDGEHRIFRIDVDGANVKQLTSGDGRQIDSSISPDGKTLAYDSVVDGNDLQTYTLKRMPVDGGEPIALTKGCFLPTYSPDGSLLSCISSVRAEILVVSASTGAEMQRYPLPAFATWNFGIGWTPDGSGLIYIVNEKGTSNIWILPRDGGKPRALTNFTSGIIYRYAFAPDGSKIYLARGYPTQDAILIKNFR